MLVVQELSCEALSIGFWDDAYVTLEDSNDDENYMKITTEQAIELAHAILNHFKEDTE